MKLAIVTGGSRGLGAALLAGYEEDGFRTVDVSRSGSADATRGRSAIRLDLADPERAADTLAREFEDLAGRAWTEVVMVANAGVLGPIGPLRRSAPSEWRRTLTIDLVSAVTTLGLFVREFQELPCRKTLVAVSSGAGSRPVAGWSLYCAAKAGLDHFVRCVALEQARERHPIRAVSVQPGVVDTAMQAEIRAADPGDFPDHARFVELVERGSLATPRQAADGLRALVAGEFEPGAVLRVGD